MEPNQKCSRLAILNEEMNAIYYADSLYWRQGNSQSKAARADYQFRKERLEEIRRELAPTTICLTSDSCQNASFVVFQGGP